MRIVYLLFTVLLSTVILQSCGSDSSTKTYHLSTVAVPSEGGTVSPASGEYEKGKEVEIRATPNPDWIFQGWKGAINSSSPIAVLKMDSSMVVSAMFSKNEYPLRLHTEGDGRVFQELIRQKTTQYPHGTTLRLTAQPEEGWIFSRWEGDIEGDENPFVVTIEEATEITAVFELPEYPLTIETRGEGTVSQRLIQKAKSTSYPYQSEVELTAAPHTGWLFKGWEGDLSGTTNPTTLKIDSDKKVTAIFEKSPYSLTLLVEGEGDVEQRVLPSKTTEYPYGTRIQLTAKAGQGWHFSHWKGDANESQNPLEVTVDSHQEITAVFVRGDVPLKVTVEGEGKVFQQVIQQPKSTHYPYETVVELTAVPEDGWQFLEWRGDLEGTRSTVEVTMDREKEVTAIFERSDFPLIVTTKGEGDVHQRIVQQPKTSSYTFETVVELTAEPAEGWHFSYWEGDLEKLKNPVEITITGATRIHAVFEPLIYMSENGITVMCPNASVGYKGTVNGIEYEVVDRPLLEKRISEGADAAILCTSLVTDMSELFKLNFDFNQPIGNWDVSNVTDMSRMFLSSEFNENISHWDVSNVTNMSGMFSETSNFNQPIGNWNVSNVTNMSRMFSENIGFNQPIGYWDVSSVTDMTYMFGGGYIGYEMTFDQPIGDWDVSNVTTMKGMFSGSLFDQDIGNWDVSSVTDMSRMFQTSLFNKPIGNWDVSNVTNMGGMFGADHSLASSSFNQPIGNWDVSNVTNMGGMFQQARSFNQNISDWDVSNVTSMNAMFYGAYAFDQDISGWNVSNVTTMHTMFHAAVVFNQDIGGWNVSNVTNMVGMFSKSVQFNQDISNWDVSSVTDMMSMFYRAEHFNRDLSGWCVSKISSEPDDFDTGADTWTLPRPVWGTCPE